jgi:hypothetical protein
MDRARDPFVLLMSDRLDAEVAGVGMDVPTAALRSALPSVGRLAGFDSQDAPLVSELKNSPGEVLRARSTVRLLRSQVGCEVLVVFEEGNPHAPIVIGVMEASPIGSAPQETEANVPSAHVDGVRQVIQAEREIVLRCGEASITLTRSGKVLIKGTYVLSRSTGYNRIKGAAIDLN